MSAVFQSGFSNLGSEAVARATKEANEYNQKLQKKEMVSQTEESLGGVKLFTSGRELGYKIVQESKLKPYLKQLKDKALNKAKQPIQEAKDKAIAKIEKALKGNQEETEQAASAVQAAPENVTAPEIQAAKSVSNDVSEARLGRIGRIALRRKQSKINRGMSEEDAEEDMNNYIMSRARTIVAKNKLNDTFQAQADEANEASQAEAKATAEARAHLKAKATAEGKSGEDVAADVGEGAEGVEGAATGAAAEAGEISGMEALGSVLDAIPGLDVIGAALGIGGLAAGFGKKPPQQITQNPNIRSSASYSQQLGIDT